jgi:hypothetical protein
VIMGINTNNDFILIIMIMWCFLQNFAGILRALQKQAYSSL